MIFEFAAQTDRVRVRSRNEDRFLVAPIGQSTSGGEQEIASFAGSLSEDEVVMFVVADGMGGHAKGDLASGIVVENFAKLASSGAATVAEALERGETVEALLRKQLEHCHAKLLLQAERKPSLHGMGSTATVALVAWPKLYVAHVGDSRCYLLRDQRLQQLTRDHSVAQYLLDLGQIDETEASESGARHQLWNALGGQAEALVVDFHNVDLKSDDQLLLCTDGLTGRLRDAQLEHGLQRCASAATRCDLFVTSANVAGGQDNITCVIARFPKPPPTDVSPIAFRPMDHISGNEQAL